MGNASDNFGLVHSFTRTIHTPFGKDLTVSEKELLIVVAAVLVCLALIVLICVLRRARKKRTADCKKTTVPDIQHTASYDKEGDSMPPEQDDLTSTVVETPTQPGDMETTSVETAGPMEDSASVVLDQPVLQDNDVIRREEDGSVGIDSPAASEQEMPLIVLIGSGGSFNRKRITQRGDIVIGRHPQRCTLVYPANERGISAVHCRVQNDNGKVFLTDLGSQCGTFVNGEQLKPNLPFRLQAGDTFWLADKTNSFFIP